MQETCLFLFIARAPGPSTVPGTDRSLLSIFGFIIQRHGVREMELYKQTHSRYLLSLVLTGTKIPMNKDIDTEKQSPCCPCVVNMSLVKKLAALVNL